MKEYHQYLQKQGYAPATIVTYTREVQKFIKWCKTHPTTPIRIDYKTTIKYLKYLQGGTTTKRTVTLQLGAIKNYLNYLVAENYKETNPIENTVIRGVKRTTNYTLLDPDELEDLYYSYQGARVPTAKRDKIIVGLLVYQGVNAKDFKLLKLEHLQLHTGKLYIPGSTKSNAREVELKPWQILELKEYLQEERLVLLQKFKSNTDIEQLIPYGERFTFIYTIVKKLKSYNQKVQNAKQIRASVITNWLQQYNLRKVQYLAGHRYISSTERYLQDDLENLHEIVNTYHPIQ